MFKVFRTPEPDGFGNLSKNLWFTCPDVFLKAPRQTSYQQYLTFYIQAR